VPVASPNFRPSGPDSLYQHRSTNAAICSSPGPAGCICGLDNPSNPNPILHTASYCACPLSAPPPFSAHAPLSTLGRLHLHLAKSGGHIAGLLINVLCVSQSCTRFITDSCPIAVAIAMAFSRDSSVMQILLPLINRSSWERKSEYLVEFLCSFLINSWSRAKQFRSLQNVALSGDIL
jgi:hypothetical protein